MSAIAVDATYVWDLGAICTLKSRRDRALHHIGCGQHNEQIPKRSFEGCSRLEDITDDTLSCPSRESHRFTSGNQGP